MTTKEIVHRNNKNILRRIVNKISILENFEVNEKTNVHNLIYTKPYKDEKN